MLIPFSNIKKVYLQILKNLAQFFAYLLFQILKSILTNPKKPDTIFLLIPFSNIKKVYLQILKNLAQFFADLLFQILKNLTQCFAYPLFQILKKEYLQISKYPFHTDNFK